MSNHFNALICGGGLAGLTLAKQLVLEGGELRIGVIEKTGRPLPDGAHKVGESTVELGSQYLESLGLKTYLCEQHLPKFGLRFFPGGGHCSIEKRTEIGPINHPIVPSYQLDRGRFESDLRGQIVDDGVHLLEETRVVDINLESGDNPHQITIETTSRTKALTADWVIDATGRSGLLRGRLRLKRGGQHEANAGWFRVRGRVDINVMASKDDSRWHQVPESQNRWLSTNHLMGRGYWVWIIPLSSQMTSIGVVTHDHIHGFEKVHDLDAVMTFLQEHEPHFARHIVEYEVIDFRCIKKYCHTISRCWHPDRWAIVGEAGAFSDPLYSPGTDYIALANSFTTELIRIDQIDPTQLLNRSRELNAQYRALINGSIGVYRKAAAVYGHAEAMASKVFWDNHVYWSFPCQFYKQKIYQLSGEKLAPFSAMGARFVELSDRMQQALKFWAEQILLSPEVPEKASGQIIVIPAFPSMLVEAHCALTQEMTVDKTFEYMNKQLKLGESLFAELILRISMSIGPILGKRMWNELSIHSWEIQLTSARLSAEILEGRQRWRTLDKVAKDVERSLGRPVVRWHPSNIADWLNISLTEVT
ncbi:MAG: tryptophan 7-halogenase [Myxococcales bacterium]|nr:tryptophan 7-halogenase [Myxococcales bacterium]